MTGDMHRGHLKYNDRKVNRVSDMIDMIRQPSTASNRTHK